MRPNSKIFSPFKMGLSFFIIFIGFAVSINYSQNTQKEILSNELKTSLIENILNIWYPLTIDTLYGGFLSDFNSSWKMNGAQNKMLVTQTRHVWTTSKMAEFISSDYKKIAESGYQFLRNKMWDNEYGGFYLMRNREGNDIPFLGSQKSSYSISFAIYALSAYFKVSKDSSALNLAKQTFHWLDEKAHDENYGGYFDLLDREGNLRVNYERKRDDRYIVQSEWKDQNSSIHLLEAFTELYSVWKDPLLQKRLEEMLFIIRDKIVGDKNYLTLYMSQNWAPISFKDSLAEIRKSNHHLDHVSFGHDVETAFLMLEASHQLGIKNDTATLAKAKAMVDHALANGWDDENGGFYYEGYYFPGASELSIINSAKVWWVQAEGLNSLLLMSELFPEDEKYFSKFIKQWEYIKKYMIDNESGGWFEEGLDISPDFINAPKSHIWKVNYHNARALMNSIKMLEESEKQH